MQQRIPVPVPYPKKERTQELIVSYTMVHLTEFNNRTITDHTIMFNAFNN